MARFTRLWLPIALAFSSACAGRSPRPTAHASSPACPLELAEIVTAAELPPSVPLPQGVVSRIEVRGARTVPEALAREAIAQIVGQPVNTDQVRRDVRRLLALTVFDDVRVFARAEGDGVVLRYEVVERPLIGEVSVAGTQIEDGAGAFPRLTHLRGEVFVPQRLRRLSERVTEDLHTDGYEEARVQVHAARAESGRVNVCFEVDPGRRWLIHDLGFDGNARIDDAALTALMATFDGRVNTAGGIYREDFFADDYLRIRAAYYDRGMVAVQIAQPVTSWSEEGGLSVRISIVEGPVYRLAGVHVRGEAAEPERVYLELMGVEAGDTFSREKLQAGMARVRDYARDNGRESVHVTLATDIDQGSHEITLWLEFPQSHDESESGAATQGLPAAHSDPPATLPAPDVELRLPTLGESQP